MTGALRLSIRVSFFLFFNFEREMHELDLTIMYAGNLVFYSHISPVVYHFVLPFCFLWFSFSFISPFQHSYLLVSPLLLSPLLSPFFAPTLSISLPLLSLPFLFPCFLTTFISTFLPNYYLFCLCFNVISLPYPECSFPDFLHHHLSVFSVSVISFF